MCVCVRACVRVCVCARVCVCMRVLLNVCARARAWSSYLLLEVTCNRG